MKTEIIINDEFSSFFPALDKETKVWLEESLLQYGCQHPLVLWNGILIDGHHRYEIIQKHGLPFTTISMDFESRDNGDTDTLRMAFQSYFVSIEKMCSSI